MLTVECAEAVVLIFALVALLDTLTDLTTDNIVKLVVLLLLLLEVGIVLFVNLQLILFHAWLRMRGLTTYDYVKMRRKVQVRHFPDKQAEAKEPPPPLSVITTLQDDLKPMAPVVREEYNLAAELRPVSEEESSYSMSESIVSGSRASRPVSSRNELL